MRVSPRILLFQKSLFCVERRFQVSFSTAAERLVDGSDLVGLSRYSCISVLVQLVPSLGYLSSVLFLLLEPFPTITRI